jgi:hypothetical protein
MTVQGELDKSAHRMEYILAIEGIGWPTDETDITQGFDGDVFVTSDLDSDLASKLSCTIHKGLNLPSGVSDSYDPRTGRYSAGAARFTIQDQDDTLLSNIKPLITNGNSGTLSSALNYDATSVVTVEQWSAGQVVWIAGREAIKLGTEGGGGPYTYSNSTRGYLGTPRGRFDDRPTAVAEFAWESGTSVHDYNRYWFDRRVALFMHVPGEAVDNVVRIYTGKLRPIRLSQQGINWIIPVTQDITTRMRRMHYGAVECVANHNDFVHPDGKFFSRGGQPVAARGFGSTVGTGRTRNPPQQVTPEEAPSIRRTINITTSSTAWREYLAPATAYNYRNRVPGGTAGMRSTIVSTPTTPQTVQDSDSRYRIDSYLQVDGNIIKALYKTPIGATQEKNYTEFLTDVASYETGSNYLGVFDNGIKIRFLLDNFAEDNVETRFPINSSSGSRWTRNPIDVLLIFLLSTNNEYKVADVTGGTVTTATFAANSFNADEWIGYSLHCVEQANNLGESRLISDNDTDTITVDRPFTNAVASGEYQIRNSIYDVLPLGWGLGVPNTQVDITSFEDIRDKYLADAQLGRFMLGLEDEVDVWDLLVDNIARPYGFMMRPDRTTGKLTAVYVGHTAVQDGLDESYTAVAAKNILDISDIDWMPRAPAGRIEVQTRSINDLAIEPVYELVQMGAANVFPPTKVLRGYKSARIASPGADGKGAIVPFVVGEKDTSIDNTQLETITYSAMFNTTDDIHDFIVPRMIGVLSQEQKPAPEADITLDMSFMLTVQAGTLLSVTDITNWNPINPYTATRGWASLVCRVISTTQILSQKNPGIKCRIQLLNSVTGGRIAPACNIDSKGGNDHITVHFPDGTAAEQADFDVDPDDLDWALFRVDDLVEIRDKLGVVQATATIAGFGSTLQTLPSGAIDGEIHFDGAPLGAYVWASGDYLTFQAWSASNTANMNLYAAYADAGETLGAASDAARKYF